MHGGVKPPPRPAKAHPGAARPPLPLREVISHRVALMRNQLSETPRRFERDEDYNRRVADEIERLARRVLEDCEALRGGHTGPGVSHE